MGKQYQKTVRAVTCNFAISTHGLETPAVITDADNPENHNTCNYFETSYLWSFSATSVINSQPLDKLQEIKPNPNPKPCYVFQLMISHPTQGKWIICY